MSRYRGIQTDIWDNEWFADQDKDLQLYWLFLLTNPWTEHSGIYRMREGIEALYCHGDGTMAAQWRHGLSTSGKAHFEGNWVYIPTYVEKQATPNVPMWKSMLDQITNAPPKFIEDWLNRYESQIPDRCADRLSMVRSQCAHPNGTVAAGCDNVNVNVNGKGKENCSRAPVGAPLPADDIPEAIQQLVFTSEDWKDTHKTWDVIAGLCEVFDHDAVLQALKDAQDAGANGPNWARPRLQDWARNGRPQKSKPHDKYDTSYPPGSKENPIDMVDGQYVQRADGKAVDPSDLKWE